MAGIDTIKLDTTELDRIAKGLNKSVEDILVSLAFDVEKHAKQLAPVDTGALKASIYTRTKRSNRRPIVQLREGAELNDLPAPQGNVVATVGPAVNYGIYVELGARYSLRGRRGMAPRPYLSTACEIVSIELNKGKTWEKIFKK